MNSDEPTLGMQDQADVHAEVMEILADAVGLKEEEGEEQDEQATKHPKWQADLAGVLEPEQLGVLREADEFLKAEDTCLT